MDTDQFIENERKKLDLEMQALQEMFAKANIKIESLPKVDLTLIDPEVRQKLEIEYGLDFSQIPQASKATPTAWRQRTKMMMV